MQKRLGVMFFTSLQKLGDPSPYIRSSYLRLVWYFMTGMGLVFYLLISFTFSSSQVSVNSKDTEKDVDVHVVISFELNLTKPGICIQHSPRIKAFQYTEIFVALQVSWT